MARDAAHEPPRQSGLRLHDWEALLIVDPQRDFCPGGALAVPEGDAIMPRLNAFLARCQPARVYVSRDWHPAQSRHFQAQGGKWPVHCVADSAGAAFHPALQLPPAAVVISKGQDANAEGYNAFEGTDAEGHQLATRLHRDGIRHVYLAGLATEYCVRATALAARDGGWQVTLLTDTIRGLRTEDAQRAILEMQNAGAHLRTSIEICTPHR